jgi:hypothetical protein
MSTPLVGKEKKKRKIQGSFKSFNKAHRKSSKD